MPICTRQNICRFVLSEHMKCLQVHRGQFILIQHSGSMSKKAASWRNIDILNLAHRIYLFPPSVGSLDLYEDYLLKDLARVFQLNQLARSNKDMILQDGHGF